jgi:hypothetical protein
VPRPGDAGDGVDSDVGSVIDVVVEIGAVAADASVGDVAVKIDVDDSADNTAEAPTVLAETAGPFFLNSLLTKTCSNRFCYRPHDWAHCYRSLNAHLAKLFVAQKLCRRDQPVRSLKHFQTFV